MICELHLENVLFIRKALLEFGAGLNVITGETGAGKSVLLESIKLLLGKKGRSGLVLPGRGQAKVQAVFDVKDHRELKTAIDELGLSDSDNPDRLVIARTFKTEGSDKVLVNGILASAQSLRQLGVHLMEIHGQNEHQTLLENRVQRRLLDRTGGDAHARVLSEYTSLYVRRRELAENLRVTEERLGRGTARIEELERMLKDLEALGLNSPEEEQELKEEANRLMHVESIASGVNTARDALSGAEELDGIVKLLRTARDGLKRASEHDVGAKEFLQRVESLEIEAADMERELDRFASRLVFDPERLSFLQSRLADIGRLQRRYGRDCQGLFALRQEALQEIGELTAPDTALEKIRQELGEVEKLCSACCRKLSERRTKLAEKLSKQVTAELEGLGFPRARVQVALQECEPGPEGAETVEFQVSFNPGAPAGPLKKIASGGELSRVALALKKVLARDDELPTLIFDEVDTGIGGTTAEKVAKSLKALGKEKQVLLVTHLHQIAKEGETHFVVGKQVRGDETEIEIVQVTGKKRETEIARMLGAVGREGRAFARSILQERAQGEEK
ncbi:MAG TPA: DNA repair protein RecN [Candidatus Ozemobacteraceae bacterium]|nr:DNA repair protein RecN [Candidatus Ozemobacteraceae bacterium]